MFTETRCTEHRAADSLRQNLPVHINREKVSTFIFLFSVCKLSLRCEPSQRVQHNKAYVVCFVRAFREWQLRGAKAAIVSRSKQTTMMQLAHITNMK